ncbi:MAG: hypothetical protein Q9186_000516 [Xanthomendoza sp. 1 TL-2023]
MAKDKDRALNPATAQLKADKARALKKGKAAISAQRNERLATRNPSRLERQIGDLKALAADSPSGLGGRDKKQLEELEKQLGLVRKAREKVGDRAPTFGAGGARGGRGEGGGGGGGGGGERGRGRGRGGVLGKRSRGDDAGREGSSSGDETDESVRRIPMPRDTPPPIPFRYRRHHHERGGRARGGHDDGHNNGFASRNANMEPLGEGRERVIHALPAKPEAAAAAVVPKTTYEAKPMVRDLRKEAVRAFMPAVVARKVMAAKGGGGSLLEEEEAEKLEKEGYMGVRRDGGKGDEGAVRVGGVVVDAAPKVEERAGVSGNDVERKRLEEEEERFGREVRMEEVSDEDL